MTNRAKNAIVYAFPVQGIFYFLERAQNTMTLFSKVQTNQAHKNKYAVAVFGLVLAASSLFTPVKAEAFQFSSQRAVALEVAAMLNSTKSFGDLPTAGKRNYIVHEDSVSVTAYNSVAGQTDDTPCIGAQGTDICVAYANGENVCAANFVPLGTKLEVEGLGTCIVRDRMNARYDKRIDWFMGYDVKAARKFGVHTKQVAIYSK